MHFIFRIYEQLFEVYEWFDRSIDLVLIIDLSVVPLTLDSVCFSTPLGVCPSLVEVVSLFSEPLFTLLLDPFWALTVWVLFDVFLFFCFPSWLCFSVMTVVWVNSNLTIYFCMDFYLYIFSSLCWYAFVKKRMKRRNKCYIFFFNYERYLLPYDLFSSYDIDGYRSMILWISQECVRRCFC